MHPLSRVYVPNAPFAVLRDSRSIERDGSAEEIIFELRAWFAQNHLVLNCSTLAAVLDFVKGDGSLLVETAVYCFGILLDPENFRDAVLTVCSADGEEWGQIVRRLGWASVIDPFSVSGTYPFRLKVPEDRRVANYLVQIYFLEEDVTVSSARFNGVPFGMPAHWLASG